MSTHGISLSVISVYIATYQHKSIYNNYANLIKPSSPFSVLTINKPRDFFITVSPENHK